MRLPLATHEMETKESMRGDRSTLIRLGTSARSGGCSVHVLQQRRVLLVVELLELCSAANARTYQKEIMAIRGIKPNVYRPVPQELIITGTLRNKNFSFSCVGPALLGYKL